MIWVHLQDVSLGFGGFPLLDNVQLQIHENEKVALIGRNGEGKSTLLKLIDKELPPDSGEIRFREGMRVACLAQVVPEDLCGSVFDILARGLGKDLEKSGRWEEIQRIDEIASRLDLDQEEKFENLSAGKKRRVLLAQALVKQPDLLLLDEPTNHLDIASIEWLENFFGNYPGAVLFVTHDRHFLQKIATRIVELDRGQLTSWECNYETYLQRKEEWLQTEQKHQQKFDKKLAQEEVWIRKGILARRTRNEGRVRRLKEMREQLRQRRKQLGSARMMAQHAEKSGNLVIHAENIGFAYDDKKIIDDFSTTIMRGDKFGIIGPNGCGKTTLLKVLLGEIAVSSGNLRHGTNLQVAYFDQLRAELDKDKSLRENIGEGNDTVVVNGKKKHIIGYIQDFLFAAEDIDKPVWTLSGGEQNRLLLAKLFLQPSNVLVLDEPTNDLDMDTLELLEQLLMDYLGTVFLVSHDRAFLNNVVTNSLVFEKDTINEYFGGYDDWLRQRPAEEEHKKKKTVYTKQASKNKLSFNEKRELEELPAKIEELEARQKQIYEQMADPQFYQQEQQKIVAAQKQLQEVAKELEQVYSRWEELEERNS